MFHIKICGVREIADIEAVFESGADAIGLNFYPPSCRFLDPEEASRAVVVQSTAMMQCGGR